MKLLITGGRGMLGRTLQREFSDGELCIADLPECDITDAAGFNRLLAAARPDAVVHYSRARHRVRPIRDWRREC